jgi:hypothetical protein
MKRTPLFPVNLGTLCLLLMLVSSPALAIDYNPVATSSSPGSTTSPGHENDNLNQARLNLSQAIDNYQNKNIEATRKNLELASEYLTKAAQNSTTDKAKEEAAKLAAAIDKFRENISQASEDQENGLTRFWHQTTSFIMREADQLTHSYIALATDEKTLKHLLDAKVHLFTAEHDLFVSHDAKDAEKELDNTLDYLNEAERVAKPVTRKRVTDLISDIQMLKEKINTRNKIWRKDSVIQSLNKALTNLDEANEKASPATKLRIAALKTDIDDLRKQEGESNIRNDYESAMSTLQSIINEP